MQQKTKAAALIGTALLGSLLITSSAFAETTQSGNQQGPGGGMGRGQMGGQMMGRQAGERAPGVMGSVASISGTTLTVTSKNPGNDSDGSKTYTVDASNATVIKNGATSTVSAIATGDNVMVEGTVSGTSITAKIIRDGMMRGAVGMGEQNGEMRGRSSTSTSPMMNGQKRGERFASSTESMMTGNGQPVVGGTVASISGSTLTITNKSNVTYTIDASAATVRKGNATSSVSNIAVGDEVIAQGTISGTSVTSSMIIDQGAKPTANGTNDAANGTNGNVDAPKQSSGFFGTVGGFFRRLFGFF